MIGGVRADCHEGISSKLFDLLPAQGNCIQFVQKVNIVCEKNRFCQQVPLLNIRKLEQFPCDRVSVCLAFLCTTIEIVHLSIVLIS